MKIKFDMEIDDAIIDLAIEKARKNGGLVPRVRGKWEHGKEIARTMLVDNTLAIEYEDWHCSACGCVVESYEFPRYKFCPNCGVDMRGEKDE